MVIKKEDVLLALEQNGVDTSSLSDDEVNSMISYATTQISNLTGLSSTPITRETVDLYPSPYLINYLLPYYPVKSIESIIINNETELTSNDYFLDKTNGIIKFRKPTIFPVDFDILTINYTSQISEAYWTNNVEPVILDYIVFQNNPIYQHSGVTSSVSEGDVSVSYDNTSSKYNTFYTTLMNSIEDLKTSNKPRATML
jgi:hypothetical protein